MQRTRSFLKTVVKATLLIVSVSWGSNGLSQNQPRYRQRAYYPYGPSQGPVGLRRAGILPGYHGFGGFSTIPALPASDEYTGYDLAPGR